MADIFLSYARADQPRIEKLAAALEEAGYTLWWDKHLRSGHQFSDDIEAALARAKAVLVVWSADAVKSEWVRDEAAIGRDANKLVAARIDDTLPPIGFRQRHAIDLDAADAMAALTQALDALIGGTHEVAAPAPKKKRTPKATLLALPLLAAIGGLGYWAWTGGIGGDGTEATAEQTNAQSIAILPFRDLSAEPQSWFSDGLAQEISAALSRTPDLKVAPTSESFRFRERTQSMADIGASLGVAHILDGAVRRSEDRIVVDIELIATATGERLFTQRYDRPVADTITVQEDIATRIATALDTALDPDALAELVDSGTNNVEAYEELLRADALFSNFQYDVVAALEHVDAAIAADQGFMRAYLKAVEILNTQVSLAETGNSEDFDRARLRARYEDYARRGEATARNEPDRLELRALSQRFNGDYRRLAATYQALEKVRPDSEQVLNGLAMSRRLSGDEKGAVEAVDRLARIIELDQDPESLINRYFDVRAYKQSAAVYDALPDTLKQRPMVMYQAHRSLLGVGRIKDAASIADRLMTIDLPEHWHAIVSIRQSCAEGNRERAFEFLQRTTSDRNAHWQALMMLGMRDEANALLRPLDFADAPYPLLDMTLYPFFDPRPFPNLMRVMQEKGLSVPERTFFQPPACPPAKEDAA